MHIVLLILKIVGITLLILLALILLLLFLLVFVPFFYRGEGSYYENKLYAKFRIRYLFPLLQVHISYMNDKPEGVVKIFGITVYDMFSPQDDAPAKEEPKQKNSDNTKTTNTENDIRSEEPPIIEESDIEDFVDNQSPQSETPEESQESKTFADKIKYFIEVIKKKLQSFLQKIKDLKEKGLQFKEKAEHITAQIKYYYRVLQMDVTQAAFHKAKLSLLRLWKSIRPKKGNIRLHFGTGDPAGTGQICGFFGMLYPFIGKYVMIEPDFEKKIYEGEFYFKGHITIFSLLRVVWLVLFDKDLKALRKILTNSNKEDKHE